MKGKGPIFVTAFDENGLEYFSYNVAFFNSSWWPIRRRGTGDNFCAFLFESMPVTRKVTGSFSTDLTERDDVLLAVLSLLLVLVIESVLATLLLRTRRGQVSNVAFSIKHFIELAREFNFRHIIKGRRKVTGKRKIDKKLLLAACALLIFTFSVEVLVLFLTTPRLIPVSNADASFELFESVFPNWRHVRDAADLFALRPCGEIFLEGVRQGRTSLIACVVTQVPEEGSLERFELSEEKVDVVIETLAHEFGADHKITIGNITATYASRVYFNLDGGVERILRKRRYVVRQETQTETIHMQYIAYLFNIYNARVGENGPRVTLEELNEIDPKYELGEEGKIDIIQVNKREKFKSVLALNRTTSFKAIMPVGVSALYFANVVFKASTAIGIGKPDVYDLRLGTGQIGGKQEVMWREESRDLNWLSLSLLLLVGLVLLLSLRRWMNPSSTTELAGCAVQMSTGQKGGQSPFEIAANDEKFFRISFVSDTSR